MIPISRLPGTYPAAAHPLSEWPTTRTELQPTPREPDCSSKFLPLPGIYPNYDLAPDGKRRRTIDNRLPRTPRASLSPHPRLRRPEGASICGLADRSRARLKLNRFHSQDGIRLVHSAILAITLSPVTPRMTPEPSRWKAARVT